MQRRRTTDTADRTMPDFAPTGGVITPVRPDVGGGFRAPRPPGDSPGQGVRDALARNLEEMAGTLTTLDPRASDRMRGLARAIATEFKENEIFPKTDTLEDWLKLLDYEPENVVTIKPIRPGQREKYSSRRGVI